MFRALYKYQKPFVDFLQSVSHPALFLEMRLGKTIVVVKYLKNHSNFKNVLIIGPISTYLSWYDEILFNFNEEVLFFAGAKKDRLKFASKLYTSRFVFANIETNRVYPEINQLNFECVIFDESVKLKAGERNSKKTKRPNTSKYYCNSFRDAKKRIILSGYPAPNTELDYFQQLKFLSHEYTKKYKSNYWYFRKYGFIEKFYKFYINASGKAWLTSVLNQCAIFRSYEDVGFITHLHEEKVLIIPEPKQLKMINNLKNKFELDGEELKLSIQVYTFMRKLSSGFVKKDCLFDSKIKQLKESLIALKGQKVAVLVNYLGEVKDLLAKLKIKYYITGSVKPPDRKLILEEFKADKENNLIVLMTSCVTYGVNLSFCNTAIFYSLPTNSDTFEQVKLRIISKQNNIGLILYFIMKHTYDEKILRGLTEKKSKFEILKGCINDQSKVLRG